MENERALHNDKHNIKSSDVEGGKNDQSSTNHYDWEGIWISLTSLWYKKGLRYVICYIVQVQQAIPWLLWYSSQVVLSSIGPHGKNLSCSKGTQDEPKLKAQRHQSNPYQPEEPTDWLLFPSKQVFILWKCLPAHLYPNRQLLLWHFDSPFAANRTMRSLYRSVFVSHHPLKMSQTIMRSQIPFV